MATKNAAVVVNTDGVQDERKPMAEPEGGWPADEFTGEPGHFVRDPFTGVRSRAPVAAAAAEAVEPPADGQ